MKPGISTLRTQPSILTGLLYRTWDPPKFADGKILGLKSFGLTRMFNVKVLGNRNFWVQKNTLGFF